MQKKIKNKLLYKLVLPVTGVLCVSFTLAACGGKTGASGTAALSDCSISHEEQFGGAYIEKTIDEFNDIGFEYGDSVNVSFSNGYVLEDIPYYNGYYTITGDPILVAYPGYPYIKACFNNGADLWEVGGLELK